MKRAVLPAVGVAGVALLVLAAAAIPVRQPAALAPGTDDRARVGVVCPTLADVETTVVAVGSAQGDLALAPLSDPDLPTPLAGSLAVSGPVSDPVVASAPRLQELSATSRAAVAGGADRGLSMVSCGRPTTSQWFTGVDQSKSGIAEVVLLNPDAQDAIVDLAVHGPQGRVAAPGARGIAVTAHSRRVVSLEPLFSSGAPVSVQVSTSAGRVAAVVRQRRLQAGRPAGSDWLPPSAEPANAVVVPGVPAGKGRRDLVVANPGERTASVALQVLGAEGPSALPGLETLNLPPGTTRTFPLDTALAGVPVGLRLTSEQPISAAVLSTSGGAAAASDVSMQVATPAVGRAGVLAWSAGRRVSPTLHLSSGSGDPVRVRVRVTAADGVLADTTLTVPGLANSAVALPRTGDGLVGIDPELPGAVHASVAVRVRLDELVSTASLAVLPAATVAVLPPIRQDPRVVA